MTTFFHTDPMNSGEGKPNGEKNMKLKDLGQFNTGIIWVVGVALIMITLIGMVTGTVQERAEDVADDDQAGTDTMAENLVGDAGDFLLENFPLLALVVTVAIIGAIILIFRSVM